MHYASAYFDLASQQPTYYRQSFFPTTKKVKKIIFVPNDEKKHESHCLNIIFIIMKNF